MYNYTIADAHCDTVSGLYREAVLYKNSGHLDICRMKQYKNWLQFFACWVDSSFSINVQTTQRDTIIDKYYSEIRLNSQYITHTTNIGEILDAWANGKIAAFLTLEGGGSIGDNLENVQLLYDKGVRLITLTWNHNNDIASCAACKVPAYGLTAFGKQAVDEMNRLGIIVDVSHLSDRGFWNLAEHMSGTNKPFVASHSNARAVCNHVRNLTDEQFLHLKSIGGVAGMNLCPLFVAADCNSYGKKVPLDGIVAHIEHFMALGGEDSIGLGCDFDGIDYALSDLQGAEHMYRLLDRLSALGYSNMQIEKIAYKNFLRVVESVCG